MKREILAVVGVVIMTATGADAAPPKAALVHEAFDDAPWGLLDAIDARLATAGFEVVRLDGGQLCSGVKAWGEPNVLVLGRSRRLPAVLLDAAIEEYVNRGGHVLFIGDRPFEQATVPWDGRWVSTDELWQTLARDAEGERVLDTGATDASAWQRAGVQAAPAAAVVAESIKGLGFKNALRFSFQQPHRWENFMFRLPHEGLAASGNAIGLWAKGDETTPQFSFELVEADGSRWIATVPVTREWMRRLLPAHAFVYWPDNQSEGRGGEGDRVRLDHVVAINVGLSDTHSPLVDLDTPHAIEVGPLEAVPVPPGCDPLASRLDMELIAPWTKHYRVRGSDFTVRPTPEGEAYLAGVDAAALAEGLREFVMPSWRQRGQGHALYRHFRWIPLIMVDDADGFARGALASLLVHFSDRFPKAAWGYMGVSDAAYRQQHQEELADLAVLLCGRLTQGVFLQQAGTRWAAEAGAMCPVKADVLNLGAAAARVALTVFALDSNGGRFWEKAAEVDVPSGATATVELGTFTAPTEPGVYDVCTEIRVAGDLVDRIVQPVRVYVVERPDPAQLVRVDGGRFTLGGQTWLPVGVNYWPRTMAGLPFRDYWPETEGVPQGHWLNPSQYEPECVENDLMRLESLGLNSLSIQCSDPLYAEPMIDFTARCRAHGIKINLYDGGNMDAVRAAHLELSDVVYAHDIRWEPRHGTEGDRQRYDWAWLRWIVDRYGSVAAAETAWGIATPRNGEGRVTGPPDAWLAEPAGGDSAEGRLALVAAYRRFLDDWVNADYRRLRKIILAADPHHLIGVRSGYGGNLSPWPAAQMPYDLVSGAKQLDFISPEGYGLGPTWAETRMGLFAHAYAKWAGNGKPVFWAEFGLAIAGGDLSSAKAQEDSPGQREKQRELYESFARLFREGGTGYAAWWYPGGWRYGENSDYGVFDPDGSPRPAIQALAASNAAILASAEAGPRREEAVLTFDRAIHPTGLPGIAAELGEVFLEAVEQGKDARLATAGTGMATATCAIHHLNGEFYAVEINDVEIVDGADIAKPAHITQVVLGNTGEAAWNAGDVRVELRRFAADPASTPESLPDTALVGTWPILAPCARYANVAVAVEGLALEAGYYMLCICLDERATRFGECLRFGIN